MVGALGAADCEARHPGLVAQPVNTVTSLAYVVAGARLALGARHLARERRRPPQATAAALVVAGVGSVAYHGPGGRISKVLHDVGVGALVATLLFTPRDVGAVAAGHRGNRARFDERGSAAGAAGLAALTAYVLGRTGSPLCRPSSRLQLHGLWHVLSAVAVSAWAQRSAGLLRLTPRRGSRTRPGPPPEPGTAGRGARRP